jgi:AcrR family transcriptional regulator
MKSARIDIASIRREQIVDAAVAVIAKQGLHNLSLSEIENAADMKRGQLTYYFKHKEDILLAVFDRVLERMYQRLGKCPGVEESNGKPDSSWPLVGHLLEAMLVRPPLSPEFGVLQYTFLSQIGYREDFRLRLAALYEEWRSSMAEGLANDLTEANGARKVSPRLLASLIQALFHGLSTQLAADPRAFDGQEMATLCLDVLGAYMGIGEARAVSPRKPGAKHKPTSRPRAKLTNGTAAASQG